MSHGRPWPYARVLAHRGGGTLAPENTLAALRTGYEHGYRAVEFDAMLAADHVPVLIHDETLERTTSGTGSVAAHRAAQLAALDAGRWHSPRFAGEPVPRLEDALRWCRTHGVWPNVEIKPATGAAVATGRAVASLTALLYADVVTSGGGTAAQVEPRVPLLSSFEPEALAAAREAAPDLPRGWLVERVPANWQRGLHDLGCVALHADHTHLTAARIRNIKDAGYWLFCYTVNDPQRARQLLGWGVDAFCTDRIDLIAFA